MENARRTPKGNPEYKTNLKKMKNKNLNFGDALKELKNGKLVAREGWNGKKNMCLWLKPAAIIKDEWCNDPILKSIVDKAGEETKALGTICRKTSDNKILNGWIASQADILSEDWFVVPDLISDNNSNIIEPEYVDLGLPSGNLWMKHPLGMSGDTDIENALYFQWGDISGSTSDTGDGRIYDWANYKYCNGNSIALTKYCAATVYGDSGFTDNNAVLENEDDAVSHIYHNWRMPLKADFDELIDTENTVHEVTAIGNVKGMLLTSKHNSNTLFLPFIGYRNGSSIYNVGSGIYLWSASLDTSAPYYAYGLDAYYLDSIYIGGSDRCGGFGVLGISSQNFANQSEQE